LKVVPVALMDNPAQIVLIKRWIRL